MDALGPAADIVQPIAFLQQTAVEALAIVVLRNEDAAIPHFLHNNGYLGALGVLQTVVQRLFEYH